MTPELFIGILLGLVAFFAGWFIRDLKKTADGHNERIRNIELLVLGSYVTKAEFDGKINAMFIKLDKIQDIATECKIQHTSGVYSHGEAQQIG